MKSSLHSLISFLPLFCNFQIISIPLPPTSYPDKPASRNSTPHWLFILLYNHFARTTQKTRPLYFWEGEFTVPLHSNGSYSIVACVFVVVVMSLPGHCLAMNIYPDFTMPAFGRHVHVSSCGISRLLNSQSFIIIFDSNQNYIMYAYGLVLSP
jgi:hypothetical protein